MHTQRALELRCGTRFILFGVPVLAATATPAPHVRPVGWSLTYVNGERRMVEPGATVVLCQAIPPTVLTVRLRYRGARPGARVRLRLRVPGHRTRTRRLRLEHRRGRLSPAFTPRGLRLRDEAFPEGRYVVRVGAGPRATLVLGGGATTC